MSNYFRAMTYTRDRGYVGFCWRGSRHQADVARELERLEQIASGCSEPGEVKIQRISREACETFIREPCFTNLLFAA